MVAQIKRTKAGDDGDKWCVYQVRWRTKHTGAVYKNFDDAKEAENHCKALASEKAGKPKLIKFDIGDVKSYAVRSPNVDLADKMYECTRCSFAWAWQAEAFAAGLRMGGAKDVEIATLVPPGTEPGNLSEHRDWWKSRDGWCSLIFNRGVKVAGVGRRKEREFEFTVEYGRFFSIHLDNPNESEGLLIANGDAVNPVGVEVFHLPDPDHDHLDDDSMERGHILDRTDERFEYVLSRLNDLFETVGENSQTRRSRSEQRALDFDAKVEGGIHVHKVRWTTPDMGLLTFPATHEAVNMDLSVPQIETDDYFTESGASSYIQVKYHRLSKLLLEGNQMCFSSAWEALAFASGLKVGGAEHSEVVDMDAAIFDAATDSRSQGEMSSSTAVFYLARCMDYFKLGLRLGGAFDADIHVDDDGFFIEKIPVKFLQGSDGNLGPKTYLAADLAFTYGGNLITADVYERENVHKEFQAVIGDEYHSEAIDYAVSKGSEEWHQLQELAQTVRGSLFSFLELPVLKNLHREIGNA